MTDQPDLPFGDDTRADQIFKRFQIFHAENPFVWKLFQAFALEVIAADRRHYSANAVFQRIRWHVDVTTRGEEPLKLNDHYHAYYARLFHVAYPEHDGFFRNRKRITVDKPAHDSDLTSFVGPEPGAEDLDLIRKLRAMI